MNSVENSVQDELHKISVNLSVQHHTKTTWIESLPSGEKENTVI